MNIGKQLHMAPQADRLSYVLNPDILMVNILTNDRHEYKTILDIWRYTLNLGQLVNQDFGNQPSYLNSKFFIKKYFIIIRQYHLKH